MTNLQLLRKQAGISQPELARKLRTSTTEISKLENGWYSRIAPGMLRRAQEIFGDAWTGDALLREVQTPDPF